MKLKPIKSLDIAEATASRAIFAGRGMPPLIQLHLVDDQGDLYELNLPYDIARLMIDQATAAYVAGMSPLKGPPNTRSGW